MFLVSFLHSWTYPLIYSFYFVDICYQSCLMELFANLYLRFLFLEMHLAGWERFVFYLRDHPMKIKLNIFLFVVHNLKISNLFFSVPTLPIISIIFRQYSYSRHQMTLVLHRNFSWDFSLHLSYLNFYYRMIEVR